MTRLPLLLGTSFATNLAVADPALADIIVKTAQISGGELVVSGTATGGTKIKLDNLYTAKVNASNGALIPCG